MLLLAVSWFCRCLEKWWSRIRHFGFGPLRHFSSWWRARSQHVARRLKSSHGRLKPNREKSRERATSVPPPLNHPASTNPRPRRRRGMLHQAKQALVDYFTRDARGRRRHPEPPVGIGVEGAEPRECKEGKRYCMDVILVYRAGSRYCCSAPPCLFSPVWDDLRRHLKRHGLPMDDPIQIRLRCLYETGALIAANHGADRPN